MSAIEKMIEAVQTVAPHYRPNAKQMRAAVLALAANITNEMVVAARKRLTLTSIDHATLNDNEMRFVLGNAIRSLSQDTNP